MWVTHATVPLLYPSLVIFRFSVTQNISRSREYATEQEVFSFSDVLSPSRCAGTCLSHGFQYVGCDPGTIRNRTVPVNPFSRGGRVGVSPRYLPGGICSMHDVYARLISREHKENIFLPGV